MKPNQNPKPLNFLPLACLTGLLAATAAADDWPGFRGPDGNGESSAKDLPPAWSEQENVLWKTALPGGGSSSPIVFGDRIFLTSYTGYLEPDNEGGSLDDLSRHLLCLSKTSGEILWDKAVKAKLPEEERIRDHGQR